MEFVPGLKHTEPYIKWVDRYPNVSLIKTQHWMTSEYMKRNFYNVPSRKKIPQLRLRHIEKMARQKTGASWIVAGHKKADSLVRRVMLQGYKFDAICEGTKKAYPLSFWNKNQVNEYIKINQIIEPIDYSCKNANGVDLNPEVFLWLRKHAPQDLETIYKYFPFSKKILYEYDYANKG